MKRVIPMRPEVAFCLALAVSAVAYGATPTVSKGTLCTTPGTASITDDTLAGWLGGINGTAKQLVVMTQCYGGNAAGAFAGAPNTAVASATKTGQQAVYGGYDNGAAPQVKPQAGKTGADIHAGGVANKAASETPTTGGGLPLNQFPLDPIGQNNIASRHVIVYAGQPNATDVAQRNTITGNNPNTPPASSVTTVGGAGGGGWNQPGTAAGLKKAIDDAKALINGAADPSKEQLILFITDHGDQHATQTRTVAVPNNSAGTRLTDVDTSNGNPTQNGMRSFSNSQSSPTYTDAGALLSSSPSFSCFFDFNLNSFQAVTGVINSIIQPSLWQMELLPHGGPSNGITSFLTNPSLLPLDIDGNGTIGDQPGEGVTMEFPVNNNFMINSFFDVFTELSLDNGTGSPWLVSNPSQDTGSVAKILPEPTMFGFACVGLFVMARRRRNA